MIFSLEFVERDEFNNVLVMGIHTTLVEFLCFIFLGNRIAVSVVLIALQFSNDKLV